LLGGSVIDWVSGCGATRVGSGPSQR